MSNAAIAGLAIAALLIGAGIGYLLARMGTNKESAKRNEVEKEFETYRDSVNEHFSKTASHFQSLGQQYRELYEHMAAGSQALCSPKDGELALPFAAAVAGIGAIEPEEATAEEVPAEEAQEATAQDDEPEAAAETAAEPGDADETAELTAIEDSATETAPAEAAEETVEAETDLAAAESEESIDAATPDTANGAEEQTANAEDEAPPPESLPTSETESSDRTLH